MEKYRNPHGQLKENLFLPLFNTNFISKFEINAGKGKRQRCIICKKCTEKDGPCTVNTRCNLVTRFSKNHNPPAPSETNVMKCMTRIEERARTSLDPRLYDNVIIQFRSQEWDDDTNCRKDNNFCFFHMISTQKTQHRTSTTTSHQTVCYYCI